MSNLISQLSNRRILVIGDLILDRYIWGNVNRISPEGPVPVVRINECSQTLGGAANVALNLKTLGCSPTLIGICGNDSAGDELFSLLDKHGIENKIIRAKNIKTTCKTRVIAQNQHMLRIDEEDVPTDHFSFHNTLLDDFTMLLQNIDSVIFSDYAKGVCHQNLLLQAIAYCRKKNIPVFVDPKRNDWPVYRGATCIKPNKVEFLSSISDSNQTEITFDQKAFLMLKKYDLDYILVTLGAEGMTLFSKGAEPVHIPAKSKEVFDVSGAGDTVIATLAACFSSGETMESSAKVANIAGGIVVGKIGTQPIYKDELSLALDLSTLNNHKLYSLDSARLVSIQWRLQGKIIVLTIGSFDPLKAEHIRFLHAAREKGDRLIIGLNSEISDKHDTEEYDSILPPYERAAILASLECVDLVVIFNEDNPVEPLHILKPDILVKSSNYNRSSTDIFDIVENYVGKVEIIPLSVDKTVVV